MNILKKFRPTASFYVSIQIFLYLYLYPMSVNIFLLILFLIHLLTNSIPISFSLSILFSLNLYSHLISFSLNLYSHSISFSLDRFLSQSLSLSQLRDSLRTQQNVILLYSILTSIVALALFLFFSEMLTPSLSLLTRTMRKHFLFLFL